MCIRDRFDYVWNIHCCSAWTFAEKRTQLCCAPRLYLLLYILLCVGFLMLHKLVVNLCVTPHVHASWRGVCWDSVLRHAVFHSGSLLALFSTCTCLLASRVTCVAPASRQLSRPPTCCTPVTVGAHFVASLPLRSTFFRAHSHTAVEGSFVGSVC